MKAILILGTLVLGGIALSTLSTKPFSPPSPDEEREFARMRRDARAIRRWSKAHGADGWSYEKLVGALAKDPKFHSWSRERLDSAIEEDADS